MMLVKPNSVSRFPRHGKNYQFGYRMVLRTYGRGRPLNAPAAFIHPCQKPIRSRHRFLNLTLFYFLALAASAPKLTVLRGSAIGSTGKMAWGDKIVVAIAILLFVLIVIALLLTYTSIRATFAL